MPLLYLLPRLAPNSKVQLVQACLRFLTVVVAIGCVETSQADVVLSMEDFEGEEVGYLLQTSANSPSTNIDYMLQGTFQADNTWILRNTPSVNGPAEGSDPSGKHIFTRSTSGNFTLIDPLPLSSGGFHRLTIEFAVNIRYSPDPDALFVEYSETNGADRDWQEILVLGSTANQSGTAFEEDRWYAGQSVSIESKDYNFTDSANIRFRSGGFGKPYPNAVGRYRRYCKRAGTEWFSGFVRTVPSREFHALVAVSAFVGVCLFLGAGEMMRSTLPLLILCLLSFGFAESAFAGAVVYDGIAGRFNQDRWRDSSNWNSGAGPVPSGTTDVVIAAGESVSAQSDTVNNDLIPFYDGDLTLEAGSWLEVALHATAQDQDFLLGTGDVFLNSDSRLTLRTPTTTTSSENLVLLGDARVDMGISTSGSHKTRTWTGQISGSGKLGIGTAAQTINLDATNTFDGGLFIGDGVGFGDDLATFNRSALVARAPFALGMGDVNIGDGIGLRIESENAMNPNATLALSGVANNSRLETNPKLRLDHDLLIRNLTIEGVSIGPGTYDSASGLVDSGGFDLIVGTGSLQVVPEPGAGLFLGLITLLVGFQGWWKARCSTCSTQ